jgi:low temperature requirement protein LtrA
MASHHESWARLRRLLWQPPRPHGEQPRARTVSPLELFFDLVVVVLVSRAAHQLAINLSWGGLGEFAAVFTVVWIAWFNATLHHELHGRDDARGRSIILLQVLALVPLGAFISDAGGARGVAFAVSAGVLFFLLTLIWFLAARGDRPEYRHTSRVAVGGTALYAAALALSAFLPAEERVLAWGVASAAFLAWFAALIATATPVVAAALTITSALNERFGLLIIIVLGEVVLGVVDGLSHASVDGTSLSVALVSVVAGFGAWWTYFDFAGHRPPRSERSTVLVWLLTHLPLTAAIAAMGAAMVSLIEHAHTTNTAASTAWGLSVSAAIVLGTTALLTTSLQAWREQPGLYKPLALVCVATAVLTLGLGIAKPPPLLFGLALTGLFSIPWIYAVVRVARHDVPKP